MAASPPSQPAEPYAVAAANQSHVVPPVEAVSPVLVNGPALWDAILERLPRGAIIAGGAVRDYLLGVEPKDIDVFLPVEEWSTYPLPGFSKLGGDRDAEYEAMPTIAIVVRGELFGRQDDAVGVWHEAGSPSPLDIINTFDFGIARCWYDGDLHDTPEAAQDREALTVTRLLHDRPERGAARFARFNERMGGVFTYRIAPETPTPTA